MRVAAPASAVLVCLLLAGCGAASHGASPTTGPATATGTRPAAAPLVTTNTTNTIAPGPVGAQLLVTDTIHFLATPTTSSRPPNGTTQETDNSAAAHLPAEAMVWDRTFKGNGTLTGGEAVFWVRVRQTLVQAGAPPAVGYGCSFALGINFDVGGKSVSDGEGCVSLGNVVAPGDYKLVFPLRVLAGFGLKVAPKDTMEVQLSVVGSSGGQEAAWAVLVGSPQDDSAIRLAGLTEPFDA